MTSLSHVATLVCNPQAPILDDELLQHVAAGLPTAGVARWLAHGVAADIPFELDEHFAMLAALRQGGDPADAGAVKAGVEALVRDALGGAPVDIVIQQAATRRKKLLLADMDSTIIGQECIDELADLVGLKTRVAAITERAMRGEIAFEPALRERVGLLAGLNANVVGDVIANRITITPGAKTLVQTMRAHGVYTALVSGGFTAFTSVIAERVGFHENRANRLVVENDKFAGRVTDPILGADAKLSSLKELREKHGLSHAETLAVGDGANDLPMLREAGLGIAFRAKPAVAAAAHARIDNADLTALLYAQGYARDEFVD